MLVEPFVAFAGGILALLSPCSALLVPAFFAYAFPSRGQLVLRTGIFYLGLLTLFVPLGLGVGALGTLFLERRAEITLIAGLVLIAIGVYQLAIGGFEIPGAGRLTGRVSGDSAGATYALGVIYGIGGFCSGPILGGVLTIAGTAGGATAGAFLLAIFAAGMAAPLLVLALLWDRLGAGGRARLRGREIQIGPLRRHVTTVVSSVLFIVLGIAFVVFQGSNAFGGLYDALGASDVSLQIEAAVRDAAPLIAPIAFGVLAVWIAIVVIRRARSV